MRGQTNFLRGILCYNGTYNLEKMLSDHARPVKYEIPLPPRATKPTDVAAGSRAAEPLAKSGNLYVHAPRGRIGRSFDDQTEAFVEKNPGWRDGVTSEVWPRHIDS
ncbi:MAG: hypothetical protein WB822_06365 [Rhodoplanes sp.]